MKKITLTLTAILLTFAVFAQNEKTKTQEVIFSDGFEAGIAGWVKETNGGDPGGWVLVTPGGGSPPPHSGSYCAGHFYAGAYPNRDAWFFSPGMALTAGNNYNISFWLRLPGWPPSEHDYFELKIGTSAASTSMLATPLYINTSTFIPDWTMISANFSPATTGTYHLGFHAFTPGTNGDMILIDDILVTAEETIIVPYITPNTGRKYTFDDLVTFSAGTVIKEGTTYIMRDDVTISALDSLVVTEDITVKILSDKTLTINSSCWIVNPPTQATFTNTATDSYYATIRIEEGAYVRLKKATFTYGSGLRVIDSDFEMDDCTLNNHNFSSIASGVISTTRGKVVVKNSTFKNNVRSAFNSAANIGCTFEIVDCHLENNVTENTNRPQINLGPCREGEITKIIGCTIIGNRALTMVGGISTSSLLGVSTNSLIENNYLKDNRYGITLTGMNINSKIIGNTLIDNNVEVNPMNGGSGINVTASAGNVHAVITENIISGHHWGITLVGNVPTLTLGPTANIGNISVPENDPEYNIGKNIFSNNGNDGELYDLYNNNPHDVMAQHNNWGVPEQTEELIRTVIRDKFNNDSYGTVTFMPPYIIEEEEICNPATNLTIRWADTACKAYLEWTAAVDMPEAKYNIYRNGILIATNVEGTVYYDEVEVAFGMHAWTVRTVCIDGEAEGATKSVMCMHQNIQEFLNDVSIHPNPTSGTVTINAETFAKVEVYNVYGQLIETTTNNIVNLESYHAGTYFFKIFDVNNYTITKRVIKL
ncbi:MAG: choice-of-anchor J domain-containing protein [Lentimicrobiaceae bacterium]|nr:choice-of-anchor J domain-containing protein [Lentimicrobiaceae bacterium]